jgi:hypothetical protein
MQILQEAISLKVHLSLSKTNQRDVLYRHYGCCETARAQSSLPKIETRLSAPVIEQIMLLLDIKG